MMMWCCCNAGPGGPTDYWGGQFFTERYFNGSCSGRYDSGGNLIPGFIQIRKKDFSSFPVSHHIAGVWGSGGAETQADLYFSVPNKGITVTTLDARIHCTTTGGGGGVPIDDVNLDVFHGPFTVFPSCPVVAIPDSTQSYTLAPIPADPNNSEIAIDLTTAYNAMVAATAPNDWSFMRIVPTSPRIEQRRGVLRMFIDSMIPTDADGFYNHSY